MLRFTLLFGAFTIAFYAALSTSVMKASVFPAYLRLVAELSGMFLNLLGVTVKVDGTLLVTSHGVLSIRLGCDASEPCALFASAVLAYPSRIGRKALGIALGVALLFVLNLVRVMSLAVIRDVAPSFFETAHLELWPLTFILAAMLCFLAWLRWANARRPGDGHAAAANG